MKNVQEKICGGGEKVEQMKGSRRKKRKMRERDRQTDRRNKETTQEGGEKSELRVNYKKGRH